MSYHYNKSKLTVRYQQKKQLMIVKTSFFMNLKKSKISSKNEAENKYQMLVCSRITNEMIRQEPL